MKSTDLDILVVAGHEGPGEAHWQSRLIAKLSAARLVEQDDWLYGSLDVAVNRLVDAVTQATKPVVFVAHSAGTILIAHAIPALRVQGLLGRAKGGFLVAPPNEQSLRGLKGIDPKFIPIPRDPLPFPSALIASSNDPHSSLEDSSDLALAWGSKLIEAGPAGHINTASGHGPWPEGMMSFAGFISRLPT
jgi:predicted alpha/beta hydrolase family esterase